VLQPYQMVRTCASKVELRHSGSLDGEQLIASQRALRQLWNKETELTMRREGRLVGMVATRFRVSRARRWWAETYSCIKNLPKADKRSISAKLMLSDAWPIRPVARRLKTRTDHRTVVVEKRPVFRTASSSAPSW